jgi:hypothetical protein
MAISSSIIRLKIPHRGVKVENLKKYLSAVRPKLIKKITSIGYSIADRMALSINESKTRTGGTSSGGLASAFREKNAVKTSLSLDIISIGVGDKSYLDNAYPYWKLIDKGGMPPKITFGYFGHGDRPNSALRGSGVGNQIWHHQDDVGSVKNFMMRPQSPILPKNFTGTTKAWANTQWRVRWKPEIADMIKNSKKK